MPDKLIEQYQTDKSRFSLFFDWLNSLPVIWRLVIIQIIIGIAFFWVSHKELHNLEVIYE